MGRWTQYDEDKYRLNGLRRVAYDADTQTYIYADENGQRYLGVPGSQYDIASPLRDNPAADRPQAFDTGRPKPTLDLKSLPTTFQEFLPASAITTPTTSGTKANGSSSSSGHSGFFDAARRAALPKIAGVVDGIKRSATTAPKSAHDEKRSLLRNPLASRKDEKRILERSATTPWKPSSQDSRYHTEEKQGIPPPPLPYGGKLSEVFEKQRSTTMGPETKQMMALPLGNRHPHGSRSLRSHPH
ncbi:hypothetical protein CPB85DRAFT_651391 [Mucidula mucida]|nr:hypothetical protein CPB85DRAFT_651391 [Mucidula mucida]